MALQNWYHGSYHSVLTELDAKSQTAKDFLQNTCPRLQVPELYFKCTVYSIFLFVTVVWVVRVVVAARLRSHKTSTSRPHTPDLEKERRSGRIPKAPKREPGGKPA
jgi:hypothetical protein